MVHTYEHYYPHFTRACMPYTQHNLLSENNKKIFYVRLSTRIYGSLHRIVKIPFIFRESQVLGLA